MNSPEIWNELGNIYTKVGAYAEAIQAYHRSLEVLGFPQDKAAIWHRIGHVYRQQSDLEQAAAAYMQAAQLSPDNAFYKASLNDALGQLCLAVDVPAVEVSRADAAEIAIIEDGPGAFLAEAELAEESHPPVPAVEPAEAFEIRPDVAQPAAGAAPDGARLEEDAVTMVALPELDTAEAEADGVTAVPGPEEVPAAALIPLEEAELELTADEVEEMTDQVPARVPTLFADLPIPEPAIDLQPEAGLETGMPAVAQAEVPMPEVAGSVVETLPAAEMEALLIEAEGDEPELAEVEPVTETATDPETGGYVAIPIAAITRGVNQFRSNVDVADLLLSVREHGIIQPIVVAPNGREGTYILITGERRLEAARLAGMDTVPALIRTASDQQQLELALVENAQRVDLNPLELAEAYHRLSEDYGLSHEAIATLVGRSRASVTNTLRLLKLSERTRQALLDDLITEGHARAMLALSDHALQNGILDVVTENELTVRQTEGLVRRLARHTEISSIPPALEREIPAAQEAEACDLAQPLTEMVDALPGTEEAAPEPAESLPVPAPAVTEEEVVVPVASVSVEEALPGVDVALAPLPEEVGDPQALTQAEPGLAVELERTEPDTQVAEPAWLPSALEGAHATALAGAAEGAPAHPSEVELAVMEQTPINLAELPVAREVVVQAEAGETLEQPAVEDTALLTAPAPAPEAVAAGPLAAVSEPVRPALVDPRNANAILAYRRVAEINPTNDRAWHVLGNLLSDLGIYEEAVPALERAVSLAPARAVYHYHLGLALAGMKRYEEAIQSFLKTVELNPEHVFAHCSLAGYYRKLGNQAAANRHINIAAPMMKLEKTYNQACFEAISGNNDHALELLEVALAADKTPVDWLRRDPDLDFLREDARFVALIKRYEARG